MSSAWESLCIRRGGSWGSDTQFARVASPYYCTPASRGFILGLRLARRGI